MTYNGHKNWAHWNVSLWINNDESLYRAALSHIRAADRSKARAARSFLYALTSNNYGAAAPTTPDGARYSYSAVYHAIRHLEA